jgi:hypothetical protein
LSGVLVGQGAGPRPNPRELAGVWWVAEPGADKLLARGRTGDASRCQTCHVLEHTQAEPPLTAWAREHLTISPSVHAADTRHACEPVGVPAQFWYTQLAPFEFVPAPGRIIQFFEHHREWRTIWLNRDHPTHLNPTYMGDSVGRWDGDTLVVDTVGFNGKSLVEPVGVDHVMSDAFHLVERWRRLGDNRIELDLAYHDPKAWGARPWGGLTKVFLLQPGMQLMESYCSPDDNAAFDETFVKPLSAPDGKP